MLDTASHQLSLTACFGCIAFVACITNRLVCMYASVYPMNFRVEVKCYTSVLYGGMLSINLTLTPHRIGNFRLVCVVTRTYH